MTVPSGFTSAQFSAGFLGMSGPYFLKREAESTIVGCRISDHHMNYIGVAHGGVLATLADVALSFQIYDRADQKLPVSTVSMTTNFLIAAKLGDWVEANATIDRFGKRLAYAHGVIRSGDRMLMTMSGVFSIIQPNITPDTTPF